MTIAERLIQQGRAEGQIKLLEQQVLEKFGSLPAALHERLTSATDEQLTRFGRQLLHAESLDGLLRD